MQYNEQMLELFKLCTKTGCNNCNLTDHSIDSCELADLVTMHYKNTVTNNLIQKTYNKMKGTL